MSSLTIHVYDDHREAAEKWANLIRDEVQNISGDVTVKSSRSEDFTALIEVVSKRQDFWRKGGTEFPQNESHDVDDADVVVLDYDLFEYSDTTGSRLAYLLRCFSGCGLILVLNRYGENVFDFNLSQPPEDFGDLHLGEEQIGNPGLWRAPFSGYRPWHWPIIPAAKANFEQCIKDVEDNPDAPVLEFLGLSQSIFWMPRRAREFLSPRENLDGVTFKSFVDSVHSGVARRDKLISKQEARVAAARVMTLLNLVLLPEQSLLVDAPHLVSRIPSLMKDESTDREVWNQICNLSGQGVDDLLDSRLRKHKFEKSHWLWRPAWIWPEINADVDIDELRNPWLGELADLVFCEDISQFVPADSAKEFKAIVSPPHINRFVFRSEAEDAPLLVPETGQGGSLDPSQVELVPQSALSS